MTRNTTYKLNDKLPNDNFNLYCYVSLDDTEILYFRNIKADKSWGNKAIAITYYDKDEELGTPSFQLISKQHTSNWNTVHGKTFDEWRSLNEKSQTI